MKKLIRTAIMGVALAVAPAAAHAGHPEVPKVKQPVKLKLVNKWQDTSIKRTDKGFRWVKIEGRFRTLWRKGNPLKAHGYDGRFGPTPPAYVKQCESGGSYTALNSSSGASGAWQFLDSTWQAMGGTGKAMHASPAEQDMRAAMLWNYGRGASHWVCA